MHELAARRTRTRPQVAGAQPATDIEAAGPIILYDGDCNLCSGAVRFVIDRDPSSTLRFAPLSSEVGRELVQRYQDQLEHPGREINGREPTRREPYSLGATGEAPATMLLIKDRKLYARSTAALKVAAHLRAPWPALALALALPRPLRDRLYDFVSKRRYRWFGANTACRLPTPAESARFLR